MKNQIPQFDKELFINQYGEEITNKIIEGYSKRRVVTLRVNTIKTDKQNVKNQLQEVGIETEDISWYEDCLIIKNSREEEIRKLINNCANNLFINNYLRRKKDAKFDQTMFGHVSCDGYGIFHDTRTGIRGRHEQP